MKPKFDECTDCRYFIARGKVANPICGECGSGQFFDERVRERRPSDNELMNMFGRMHDDD